MQAGLDLPAPERRKASLMLAIHTKILRQTLFSMFSDFVLSPLNTDHVEIFSK